MAMKYGLVSLLALFIIALLLFKNYEIWTLPIEVIPERETVKKPGPRIESPSVTGGEKASVSIRSYINIAQKNIFTPDRKDFPVQAVVSPAEVKKTIARPQVILYGVAIVGDKELASLANLSSSMSSPNPMSPTSPPGPRRVPQRDGRDVMTVKVGDKVGEYKVAKILPDRVTLEGGEDSFEVLLYESKTEKQRSYVKTENRPAAVTGPGGPPAAVPAKPAEKPAEITTPAPVTRPVTPSAPVPPPSRRVRTIPTRPMTPSGPIPSTPGPSTVGPVPAMPPGALPPE